MELHDSMPELEKEDYFALANACMLCKSYELLSNYLANISKRSGWNQRDVLLETMVDQQSRFNVRAKGLGDAGDIQDE